jgi:hypothetical protein
MDAFAQPDYSFDWQVVRGNPCQGRVMNLDA